jgi:hypothetical protein
MAAMTNTLTLGCALSTADSCMRQHGKDDQLIAGVTIVTSHAPVTTRLAGGARRWSPLRRACAQLSTPVESIQHVGRQLGTTSSDHVSSVTAHVVGDRCRADVLMY